MRVQLGRHERQHIWDDSNNSTSGTTPTTVHLGRHERQHIWDDSNNSTSGTTPTTVHLGRLQRQHIWDDTNDSTSGMTPTTVQLGRLQRQRDDTNSNALVRIQRFIKQVKFTKIHTYLDLRQITISGLLEEVTVMHTKWTKVI